MKRKQKQSKNKALFNKAKPYFYQYKNAVTREAYIKHFRDFLRYCTLNHKIKSIEELKGNVELIQEYADYLKAKGLTASTVHTYIAPICGFCGVNMKEIEKAKRVTAEYKKGRTGERKINRSDNNLSNPKYERSVEFQKRVGIRRNELKKLKGRDFIYDERLGFWYVFVEKGKGGKPQKQRILPKDVEFIEKYFKDKKPGEKIFSASELENKLNYHALRAEHAKECYKYYLDKLNGENGEEYREELKTLIWKRFHEKKGFRGTQETYNAFIKEITGTYKVRGENKQLAIEHGLPTEYDKLAVMAVSVFHLSHWRNNVTIQSYLLAW